MRRYLRYKWTHRGVLILIGIAFAVLYSGGYSQDLLVTPLVFGFVIGILSKNARNAYLNSATILICEMIIILFLSFARLAGPGAGANFVHMTGIRRYVALTVLALSDYAMEIVAWILGVTVGSFIHSAFKKLQSHKSAKNFRQT